MVSPERWRGEGATKGIRLPREEGGDEEEDGDGGVATNGEVLGYIR